jgi:hypothetical protein
VSELPTRIFLRPIGSPLTIGMSGLAIASLVQSGLGGAAAQARVPTFRRGRGDLSPSDDVMREAGVRQTS